MSQEHSQSNTNQQPSFILPSNDSVPARYPTGFPDLLKSLSQQILLHQPKDILSFCADYFRKLQKEQATKMPPPPEKMDIDDHSDIESDHSSETEDIAPPVNFPPPAANRGRRTSVSAESMAPSESENHEKIVIPKADEQRARIQQAIGNNFLFRNLDEEQYKDVVNAMAEKKVAKGEDVIKQGGVGDFFYIVEVGTLDVFVSRNGAPAVKVTDYASGGSFGELALMYNAPRAATVTATSDCTLWALDRVTFRRILMDSTARKRRMYEAFLEEVPLLSSLEPYERHKISDALESIVFVDGDVVIRQGEPGNNFYIIESGDARVLQKDESGTEQEIALLKKGDYFGELALLSNKPRAATVIAKGKLKCATLGKKAFDRLLGPVLDIVKRNVSSYKALTRRKSIQDLVAKIEAGVTEATV